MVCLPIQNSVSALRWTSAAAQEQDKTTRTFVLSPRNAKCFSSASQNSQQYLRDIEHTIWDRPRMCQRDGIPAGPTSSPTRPPLHRPIPQDHPTAKWRPSFTQQGSEAARRLLRHRPGCGHKASRRQEARACLHRKGMLRGKPDVAPRRQRTAAKRKASSVVTAICRTMPPRISMTTRHWLKSSPALQRTRRELPPAGQRCQWHRQLAPPRAKATHRHSLRQSPRLCAGPSPFSTALTHGRARPPRNAAAQRRPAATTQNREVWFWSERRLPRAATRHA